MNATIHYMKLNPKGGIIMLFKRSKKQRDAQPLNVQLATIREYQRVTDTIYSYQQLF